MAVVATSAWHKIINHSALDITVKRRNYERKQYHPSSWKVSQNDCGSPHGNLAMRLSSLSIRLDDRTTILHTLQARYE